MDHYHCFLDLLDVELDVPDDQQHQSADITESTDSYHENRSLASYCKQISTPPQPFQKIPDIYFLCSCSLPNVTSILSPITIQFVVDVFVLYVFFVFSIVLLYCAIWSYDHKVE